MTYGNMSLMEVNLNYSPPKAILEKLKAEQEETELSFQTLITIALNNYYNSVDKPDVEAFTRAYCANYDNLSPTEIIRQEILNDPFNKGLRPTAIAKLLNERLSKYDLDAEDPDDRADAEDLLRREAEIVKSRMIKAGKDLVSQYSSDLEIELDAPVQQTQPSEDEVKAQRDALVAQYSPEVEKYIKNGVIQIQDKDGTINIPAVDAKEYVDSLVDPVGFIRSLVLNPDGTPNIGKWIQFVTASRNMSKYNSAMIAHGVSVGQSKLASKIKNEVPLGQPRPVEASSGIIDPTLDPMGFAQALQRIRPYKVN